MQAVEQLRDGPRRQAALAVGSQLVAAGVLVACALPALPGLLALDDLLALEDLLLAAGLAVSARSTALAAQRTAWWDSYVVAQLSAVVVLSLAGVLRAGGPAASGLPFVLLVLCSAPYLLPLQRAVVVAGCAAGHLATLVAQGTGAAVGQRWLTLTGLLVVAVLVTSAPAADRAALHDLVTLQVTDRVTGLPTARYLDEAGRHAAARTSRTGPLAVVALRLEGLDELVRGHGQDVADAMLEQLARRLSAALRPGDVLARTAPDELVALLPHADALVAADTAAALRAAAADVGEPGPRVVTGVASAPPRHTPGRVADLVARARAQQPSPTRGADGGEDGSGRHGGGQARGGWYGVPVGVGAQPSSGMRNQSSG